MVEEIDRLFRESVHAMPVDHLPPSRLYNARATAFEALLQGEEPQLPLPVLGFSVFEGFMCRACGKCFTSEKIFRDHVTRKENGTESHHGPWRAHIFPTLVQRFSLFPSHATTYAPVSPL
jgi:hypothetical protein